MALASSVRPRSLANHLETLPKGAAPQRKRSRSSLEDGGRCVKTTTRGDFREVVE
jgi:hypothetical protein